MTPEQYINSQSALRSHGGIVCPAVAPGTHNPYPVTYGWGVPDSMAATGHHTGEDHACPVGTLAVATSWGKVIGTGWSALGWGQAYGYMVIIRTKTGKYDYALCHLSHVLAHVGQIIFPGTVVGLSGATGNVTGPHIHFEARPAGGRYGSDIDPIHVKQKGH